MKITRTQTGVGFRLTQEMIDGGELSDIIGADNVVLGSPQHKQFSHSLLRHGMIWKFVNMRRMGRLPEVGLWFIKIKGTLLWHAYTPAEFEANGFEVGEEDE